jgi:ATP phosphoribosyltransferase
MIRIGVPSKGRLMQETFDWFGARGVTMRQSGAEREYSGIIDGIDGVALVLLSASEIPRELATGRIHLGVTGSDLVCEELGVDAPEVRALVRLGFGQADLILAVPAVWIDVETVDDLDAAAAGFRAAHGHRLRIATKYHRLVREFLQAQGVADYQLVDSQGATEGTVKNGTAEAIADITSSGETLRANHLRVLSDGLIHQSEAVLWSSRTAEWTAENRAVMARLAKALGVNMPFQNWTVPRADLPF